MIKIFDKKLLFSLCGIIIIFLLVFTAYTNYQAIYTSGSTLDNKKIGWGIKREKDHKRPDVGKENAELMEKYNGIYLGNEQNKYIYLKHHLNTLNHKHSYTLSSLLLFFTLLYIISSSYNFV